VRTLTIILFLILASDIFSQNTDNKVYITVDSLPEFIYQGCENTQACIDLFFDTHKKWPPFQDYIKATIIIQCIVEKNGKLTNFKILRGLETLYDKESVEVLKNMPPWKPGEIKGKKVRTQIIIRAKWEG